MKALNFESLIILSWIHVGLQVFGASNDSGNLSLRSIKTFGVPSFMCSHVCKLITFLCIGTERIQVYSDTEHFSYKDCPYIRSRQHNLHFLVFPLVLSISNHRSNKTKRGFNLENQRILCRYFSTILNKIRLREIEPFLYPRLQSQLYEPWVFMQFAFSWHGLVLHSSIS